MSFEKGQCEMLIGYARVSSHDQNLHLQIDELKKAGCSKIFSDKMSGMKKSRPGLDDALSYMRKNDTLVIWKLDRLGRSVNGLISLVEKLKQEGIHFQSITDGIDTATPAGRFFFHVMASLAQMERELLIERTKAGLAAARERGRVGGRKRSMTESKVKAAKKLLYEGMSATDVAENLGVSIPTLYRWCPAFERNSSSDK
jgi:DNA invertase Pin-like site-specific DNA recombinase